MVALLLAAVGLYGVVAFAVAQRTREIGIRVALGAQSSEVLRLMLRQGMTLAGIGLLVGLPLAIGAGKLVSGFLLGAGAADPLVFIVAAVTLGLVTLVASYVPARRASRVDPMRRCAPSSAYSASLVVSTAAAHPIAMPSGRSWLRAEPLLVQPFAINYCPNAYSH